MFADRVQRRDVGAPLEQRVHGSPLVLERQVPGGHRHQCRRAARQEHDERVARVGPLRNLEGAASCGNAARVRQRMARWNPLERGGQRNRQVRADDNAVTNPIARKGRECVGHEGRGLADGNDAQALTVQARRDRRVLHGAIDQLMWRRGVDGAVRDGQKVLAKERQGRRLSERSSDRSSSTAPSRR